MIVRYNGKKYAYDKTEYFRNYMRNKRDRAKMKKLIGLSYSPRDIEEEKIFTKEDYEYIKTINNNLYI